MAEPGGELETLWPRDDSAVGRGRGGPASPRRVQRLLVTGAALLAIGALVQFLALAWFVLLRFLLRGSAAVLVHTGGLERRTFAACSIAAFVLDAVLLTAIATRSVRRALRRAPPADERFARRHPFCACSAGLLLALAFVIASGWRPSAYFPYPLATVVVLATAYWFGLLGVLAIARGADLVWRALRAWGATARWRTSLLAASLVLAAAACCGLLSTRWYAGPRRAIATGLALESAGHTGDVLDSELDGLCLVADDLEPSLAHSSAAPACEFLTTESRPLDDCVAALIHDWVPGLRQQLRQRGLDAYGIDDAVLKAMLATCSRQPPPRVPHAYLFATAETLAAPLASAARHAVACDPGLPLGVTCAAGEPPASRAGKLAQLWDDAVCRVGDEAAQILRRRLQQDESFHEIGDHLGLPETDVLETYHRAIKQLRTAALDSCDDR